jgi:sialate O-acetylesterase
MKLLKLPLLLCLLFCFGTQAQISLPKLISDNIVLQRDQPIKIWGWASPNEKLTVLFNKKTFKTTTSENGKWELLLPAQSAGTAYKMVLKGKNEITINNIAFGDVWLCSGQSNMTVTMERVKERFPEDIESANYPDIRYFFVPTLTNLNTPKDDFPQGEWKTANPNDITSFGALAYFFARDIYTKYQVPIGIINSSVGGTPIEAWISENGYKNLPDIQKTIAQNKDSSYVNSLNRRPSTTILNSPKINDLGSIEHWENPNYIPKGWRNFNIPGYWEDQGLKDLNGVVWFRREFEVPKSWLGKSIKLFMGRIVDADEMYVNGKKIGNITYQYPPRRYEIPADLLKEGKNIFVIKVTNTSGKGGFVPDKNYSMTVNGEVIDLKGTWQYKVGEAYQPQKNSGFGGGMVQQNQPTALYNAMIAPILPLKIKGILWYQGESNTGNPEKYDVLMPTLITDWRNLWKDEKLPFFAVQLANFQDINYTPSESNWARLREAQNQALKLPNTAVTVTIDLGEWNDIHPLNKKDIGKRLAFAAENIAYNDKKVIYSGPTFKSQTIENGKIILTFDNVGEGITLKDGEELRWFSIADYDKKFVWAKTRIVGKNQIEVWNEDLKSPKYVRYAWQDNPEGVNFYNSANLPASPFRTDDEILDNNKH